MMQPPRAVEALLSALGADPAFRDALLGDMNEELNARSARDGETAARWWYYGEAIRSTPHLARNGLAHATWTGARRVGRAMLTGIVGMYIFAFVFGGIARAFAQLSGFVWAVDLRHPTPALLAATFTLGAAASMLSGYFAAMMDDETPLVSAMMLALVWATIDTIALMLARQIYPWQIAVPVVPLLGATVGGMLRASRRRLA